MAQPKTMLEVSGLTAGYGSVVVLNDVSFELTAGELLLLVGPNGAGKSTLMKTLMGLHKASTGRVVLDGTDVTKAKPNTRMKLGMALIFEGRGIIPELSVQENLDLAKFAPGWTAARREASFERFPILGRTFKRSAGTLSGGEQQMLAIARALETGAKLLMFDEPSLGLAPKIVSRVLEVLGELLEEGNTILLVEQRAAQVEHIATRALVMRQGQIEESHGKLEFTEMSFEDFVGRE